MSSDEEYMVGDISDGEYVDGEFFNAQRRSRPQTKDDAIYGVFGDLEEQDRAFNARRHRQRKIPLSAPISFVSGGKIDPKKEEAKRKAKEEKARQRREARAKAKAEAEEKARKEEEKARDDEDAYGGRRGGIGSGSNKRRARWKAHTDEELSRTPKQQKLESDWGQFTKHTTGFGLKYLQKFGYGQKGRGIGSREHGMVNPIQIKRRPQNMGMGFGNFKESNDSLKFRNAEEEAEAAEQGDSGGDDPSGNERDGANQAQPRGNWKKKVLKPKKVYKTASELAIPSSESTATSAQMIVDMRGPTVKVYGMDQYASNNCTFGSPTAEAEQWLTVPSNGALPELHHNIETLVEHTEMDIRQAHSELEYQKNKLVAVKHELSLFEEQGLQQKIIANGLRQALTCIDATHHQLRQIKISGNSLDKRIECIADSLSMLQSSHPFIYEQFYLSSWGLAMFMPLMKALFHTWDPLPIDLHSNSDIHDRLNDGFGHSQQNDSQMHTANKETVEKLARLNQVKHALGSIASEHGCDEFSSAFVHIVNATLIPKVQLGLGSWPIRQFVAPIHLLRKIRPYCSQKQFKHLVTSTVINRLQTELDVKWNPRLDPQLCNEWILPYADLISDDATLDTKKMMNPLYQTIRKKLSIVLQKWSFADESAVNVVQPWINHWTSSDMQSFTRRSILPKLKEGLDRKFFVNPARQDMTPIHHVLNWEGLLSKHDLIQLLYRTFFPKWFDALYDWLHQSSDRRHRKGTHDDDDDEDDEDEGPDFQEISQWYLGWKQAFPSGLVDHPAMAAMFTKGLDLMNVALDQGDLEQEFKSLKTQLKKGYVEPRPQLSQGNASDTPLTRSCSIQARLRQEVAQVADRENKHKRVVGNNSDEDGYGDMSFKDAMEQFAAMNGITFMPNTRRGRKDGNQIYNFGPCTVYMDKSVIHVYHEQNWMPISMQSLLELANKDIE